MVLKHSWAAPSCTAPTQLQSHTEVTQHYPDCRLIYLPPSCSLVLLQSSNSGRDTAQASTSQRQLQPAPLHNAASATSSKFQQVLKTHNAASATSWKFQQVLKTRSGYFSHLRHSIQTLCALEYFLDGPLTPAALFLFSTQLFPANSHYTATVRLSP